MDEFRIAPTSPDNPYRDPAQSGAKHRRRSPQPVPQDDVVSLSGPDSDPAEGTHDYYSPAKAPEDQE